MPEKMVSSICHHQSYYSYLCVGSRKQRQEAGSITGECLWWLLASTWRRYPTIAKIKRKVASCFARVGASSHAFVHTYLKPDRLMNRLICLRQRWRNMGDIQHQMTATQCVSSSVSVKSSHPFHRPKQEKNQHLGGRRKWIDAYRSMPGAVHALVIVSDHDRPEVFVHSSTHPQNAVDS
jgi:hypothetical protein